MKQFFKFMFASMLGTILTILIVFFLLMGLVMSIASYSEKEAISIKPNTVLHMKLNTPIFDRTPKNPFEQFNFQTMEPLEMIGLNDILNNLEKAAKDPNIKGIYLDLSVIPTGMATIEEIRDALIEFKQSGKFIICYGNVLDQAAYYMASVADEIYMSPEGMILFKGLNAEVMFLKGTLEKLDIDMQVIREGKYKGAIEPFTRENLSEANREQIQELIKVVWSQISGTIAESRNIDIYDLNLIANNLDVTNSASALKYKFIDGLKYKDEITTLLKKKLNIEEDNKIEQISISKYTHVKLDKKEKEYTRDRIAVVYGSGNIIMGQGDEQTMGAEKVSKALRQARNDDNVKAIVFRVNSPGGDAFASDIIWREVQLAAETKPLVVSMGDLAASGGYWISTPADRILADPITITGSIGAYGMFPNLKDFFNNKLGITFDNVKTNENADFLSISKPLSSYQEQIIEQEMDQVYNSFLQKVASGRKLSVDYVDSIGQGRVWSGSDAKRIGLVDEFGGLKRSIKAAAELSELTNYRIKELPELKDPIEEFFNTLFGNPSANLIQQELGSYYDYYQYLKSIKESNGIQARMPYLIEFN
ncbi:MAG: signal peptide peptidase SppA [Bacteroidales bacterium]|nr:signal peptide peptidase SppA [Bacteroidales bacterium]MCF8387307.1 signal peptide peptidase SppA [Bacteroidales bacterium]MCF8397961.1 signal peptide peptidase SppA [Bacteroidales bacterium]